jgi:LysR family transcriptional regulator for bpeEF and oprC
MDRLHAMEVFVRVAEAGSFSRAANQLDLGNAAVTAAIKNLENHLGARLFHRTTRSVSLTEDGAAYLERCRRILDDVQDAEDGLSRARRSPAGHLRVEMPYAIGRLYVLPAWPRFSAQYPDLKVTALLNDRVVDLVEEGLDAAIRVGELKDSSYIARPLRRFGSIACASPEYLERMGQPHTPEDLHGHQCLALYNASQHRVQPWLFERAGQQFSFTPDAKIVTNSVEALVDAAISGAGIVYTGNGVVSRPLRSGELVPVLADYATQTTPLSLVYPASRHLTAKLRAFADFVSGLFPES